MRLPRILLPHRFQQIRHIRYSVAFQCPIQRNAYRDSELSSSRTYRPPENFALWTSACEIFASLGHLQTFEVEIALWCVVPTNRLPNDEDSIYAILEPLRQVHALKFSVVLTEAFPIAVQVRLGQIPFSVSQRERPGVGFLSSCTDD